MAAITTEQPYVSMAAASAALRNHGQPMPADMAAYGRQLVRASRFVDMLEFRDDPSDRKDYQRWNDDGDVPERVKQAVALLAAALPADGAPIPRPRREPVSVGAGAASVSFAPSDADLQPAQSTDEIMAGQLGIPSVAAFQLLRPFLLLPTRLNQDVRSRGGTFVAVGNDVPKVNFNTYAGDEE